MDDVTELQGRSFERRAVEDNAAWAMRLVRKLFGAHVPDPTVHTQTAWHQDPMSFGSYTSAGLRAMKGDRVVLGKQVDSTLYFAGERCSTTIPGLHYSYMFVLTLLVG